MKTTKEQYAQLKQETKPMEYTYSVDFHSTLETTYLSSYIGGASTLEQAETDINRYMQYYMRLNKQVYKASIQDYCPVCNGHGSLDIGVRKAIMKVCPNCKGNTGNTVKIYADIPFVRPELE
jgi:hypothetical protein